MTQKFMSDARQTQLVEATRKAADLHLEGMPASEAVAKCASEIGANQHVLQRMVEAFNTSKTLAHLKTAEGAERSETFELASFMDASELLFPSGEQAKAAAHQEELDLEIPDPFAGQEKAAHEGIPEILRVEDVTPQMDPARRYKLAFDTVDRLRRASHTHRAEAEGFRIKAEGAIQKLASVFRQADRPDWARFESEASTLYKGEAAPYLDAVYTLGNLSAIKVAREQVQAPVYINTSTDTHKLLKIAMYAADLAAEEFATSQKFAAEYEKAREELMGIGQVKEAIDPLVGMLAYQNLQGMMDKSIDKHVEDMIPKDKPSVDLSSDVGVESELAKAKLQATVRDMMEGDDVVSQHAQENPQAITQAISELTKMSPEIGKNPMLLRGALRRQLEMGQLEPFELKQIQDVAKPNVAQGVTK